MSRLFLIIAWGILSSSLAIASVEPESSHDKRVVSYAFGYTVAENLLKDDPDLVVEDMVQGLRAAFDPSKTPRMTAQQMHSVVMLYNREIAKLREKRFAQVSKENARVAADFARQYEMEPGVKRDEAGFLYKVLQSGNGALPKRVDDVIIDYSLRRLNGELLFSTRELKKKAQINVGRSLPIWTVALQKMKEGARWEILTPPELAYGERGLGEKVGPSESLIFDLTLVRILPAN